MQKHEAEGFRNQYGIFSSSGERNGSVGASLISAWRIFSIRLKPFSIAVVSLTAVVVTLSFVSPALAEGPSVESEPQAHEVSPTADASAEDAESLTQADGAYLEDIEREPAQARKNQKKKKATQGRMSKAAQLAPLGDELPDSRVERIVIKGNKKIETDAILARLATKLQEAYSGRRIRQDVDALFRTGFFYDIRVEREITQGKGILLTYTVVEKPSLAEISFSGNKDVETDDLKEAVTLKAFEILNMNKVREATEKLQKLYEDKGYFLAKVTPRIEPIVEGESVKLTFDIQENDKVKVKRITFLGNRNIGDNKLKNFMQTQEGGFFSFMSGSGAYKQDAFDRDIQVLSYAYFNEGYVQVKIDRPQVYVTPDKRGVYITIRVEEGERFKIGSVDFAGDLLFDRTDLDEAIEIDGSGWYVHETLLKDMRTLQARYGDLGYAYANIIPRTRLREKDREVDITFEIDKGNKVYFGKINVLGNTRTRDKVIRRELAIRETELYNETRKRESLDSVRRLGFFEEVNFNSKTPSDNADQMDIDIVVKERNTGTIQVGAGYSTYSQFIFNGQVNQINLFGRGQKLGISVDLSSNNSIWNLNFTEPYFMDTEWSLGFDGYQTVRRTVEYEEAKKGGALRIGHPLAKYLYGYVRYKLDNTQIYLNEVYGDPSVYADEAGEPGYPNGLTSSGTFTLEYDKRNDRYTPSKGLYVSSSLEYAGLGGDKKYTKGIFTARYYEKVFWEFVFRNNLTYGMIRSNDGGEPPYNELFLLGGANSLRGYNWYSVGRKKFSSKRFACYNDNSPTRPDYCKSFPYSPSDAARKSLVPYGGSQQLYYQAELEFPLVSEAGIKGVVFYDIGTAEDQVIDNQLKQDYGFGFRWFSPIGPLRFEWGFPIDRGPDDPAMQFQFAIGSPF